MNKWTGWEQPKLSPATEMAIKVIGIVILGLLVVNVVIPWLMAPTVLYVTLTPVLP